MKIKKILSALLALSLIIMSVALLGSCGKKNDEKMSVFVLKGPTGVGAVSLMDKSSAENTDTKGNYEFTLVSSADEIRAKLLNGEANIAAVPTNLASTLYSKTDKDIVVLAVNTLGVLYILDSTGEIKNVKDLSGKTIYSTGQGSNPEYILEYVLEKNGVTDAKIEFLSENDELATKMISGDIEIALVPQPVATQITVKNQNVKIALDMTEEWNNIGGDSALMMGCVVTTKKYLENHKKEVNTFLDEYKASIETVLSDVDAAAALCEKHGIIPAAAIAKKAIPYCNLCFKTGEEMEKALSGYLKVLFDANPKSIGGALPESDFYYKDYENK